MLDEPEILEAKRIAELAAAARASWQRLLEKTREAEPGEPKPVHGEHNPAGDLGLDALPSDDPARRVLRDAIADLPSDRRAKLWALMMVGRGDYAAKEWDQAILAAASMTDESVINDFVDEVELHDFLNKGLYELGLARYVSSPH